MLSVNVFVEITSCPEELRRFDSWEQYWQLRPVRWPLHGPSADDVSADSLVNQSDRSVWVEDLKSTYFGDANLDGEFNSTDFVTVFIAGEYEDGVDGNSVWETGDWNGDGDFNTTDFVLAFQSGGYEQHYFS